MSEQQPTPTEEKNAPGGDQTIPTADKTAPGEDETIVSGGAAVESSDAIVNTEPVYANVDISEFK